MYFAARLPSAAMGDDHFKSVRSRVSIYLARRMVVPASGQARTRRSGRYWRAVRGE